MTLSLTHSLSHWVTDSQYFYFWHTQSNTRDLWPLQHLIRELRRHDLTEKIPTQLPTYLLVHCCYYISLLPGWWNIVQNGDPLYADVDYKWDCGGHIWANWVQFFCKKTLGSYLRYEKFFFELQKINSGVLGRHIVQTLVIFNPHFWKFSRNED